MNQCVFQYSIVHGRQGGDDLKKGRGVPIVNHDHSHMLEDRHLCLVSRI